MYPRQMLALLKHSTRNDFGAYIVSLQPLLLIFPLQKNSKHNLKTICDDCFLFLVFFIYS